MKKLPLLLLILASSAHAEIYTWTDSRGTTHYTNSQYDIPARYQGKAKVLDLGPGQKQDAPPQPGVPAQPTPPAPTPPVSGGAGNVPQIAPAPQPDPRRQQQPPPPRPARTRERTPRTEDLEE